MSHSRNASIIALTEAHLDLDELFLQHQELLLKRNLADAAQKLAEYKSELTHHMVLEEKSLFPIYATVDAPPGGGLELFQAEHGKIRELLAQIELELAGLAPELSDLSRRILKLLDEESVLKRVMEHHDLRERSFLYPEVDRAASESQRRRIMAEARKPSSAGA